MKKRNVFIRLTGAMLALMLIAAGLGGCATHQARSMGYAGFLGDYSKLREGGSGQAKMVYINPSVGIAKYDAILLEPIRAYPGSKGASLSSMSPETLKSLLNYFDAAIRRELSKDYSFVNNPGPNVMRFRVALTESQGARVVADTVSTVLPQGIAISALSRAAFGRAPAVGSAGVEFEALDSQTNEQLAAGVDRRIGNKITGQLNKFSKWRATKSSCDYWAEKLRERLEDIRNASAVGKR